MAYLSLLLDFSLLYLTAVHESYWCFSSHCSLCFIVTCLAPSVRPCSNTLQAAAAALVLALISSKRPLQRDGMLRYGHVCRRWCLHTCYDCRFSRPRSCVSDFQAAESQGKFSPCSNHCHIFIVAAALVLVDSRFYGACCCQHGQFFHCSAFAWRLFEPAAYRHFACGDRFRRRSGAFVVTSTGTQVSASVASALIRPVVHTVKG